LLVRIAPCQARGDKFWEGSGEEIVNKKDGKEAIFFHLRVLVASIWFELV
jgi:hypothetical protein